MRVEVLPDDGFHSVRIHLADRWNAIRVFDAADEGEALEKGLPILLDWSRA